MKQTYLYFKLECKKFIQALPGILAGTLLIGLILAGVIVMCQTHMKDAADSKQIQIGVVAQENEPYLDWMISTIENMESLEFTCKFVKCKENIANEKLRSGELNAVFIIPKNYITSLINGNENPMKIRLGKSDTTISGFLIRQIGDAASRFMTDTQSGIYAMKDFYQKHSLPNLQEDELTLNMKYLDNIVTRTRLVTTEEVIPEENLHGDAAFFTAGLVLFLLFWGLTCPGILRPEPTAFQIKLHTEGIGTARQTFAQYVAFTLVFSINYLTAALLLSFGITLAGGTLSGAAPVGTLGWLWCFVKILPIVLPACALIQLTYGLVTEKAAGVLFLFLLILILGYLSGCFYPLSWLPRSIQSAAPFLPTRAMYEYTGICIGGSWSFGTLLYLFAHTFLLLGLLVFIRVRRNKL